MDRSQNSSRGVLGPLGLILVAVLWLMTLSGNIPTGSQNAASHDTEKTYVVDEVVPTPELARGSLATHPASLSTAGKGT